MLVLKWIDFLGNGNVLQNDGVVYQNHGLVLGNNTFLENGDIND